MSATSVPTLPSKIPPPPAKVAPEAFSDPVGYLLFHSWACDMADNRHSDARWYDPTKPREATEDKRVITSRKEERTGRIIETMQTHVTPAAWPLTLGAAVQIQRERDAQAAKKGA